MSWKRGKIYGRVLVYSNFTRMKRAQYIFATGLILVSTAAFAVTGPALPESTYIETDTMSGEVVMPNPPISLYSAPEEQETNMSGEINITIPYDPNEVDRPESWLPDEPRNINLNSASQVSAGPVFNMLIALVLSLMISGFVYTKSRRFIK